MVRGTQLKNGKQPLNLDTVRADEHIMGTTSIRRFVITLEHLAHATTRKSNLARMKNHLNHQHLLLHNLKRVTATTSLQCPIPTTSLGFLRMSISTAMVHSDSRIVHVTLGTRKSAKAPVHGQGVWLMTSAASALLSDSHSKPMKGTANHDRSITASSEGAPRVDVRR